MLEVVSSSLIGPLGVHMFSTLVGVTGRVLTSPGRNFKGIHSSIAFRRSASPSPYRLGAQLEKPPLVTEPRFDLGPALKQAGALSYQLSYVAP